MTWHRNGDCNTRPAAGPHSRRARPIRIHREVRTLVSLDGVMDVPIWLVSIDLPTAGVKLVTMQYTWESAVAAADVCRRLPNISDWQVAQ